MMVRYHRLAVVVAIAGLFAAMPAAARVKIAKYTGTVSWGYDATGLFGAPGSDLAGSHWVATYTYDKVLGGAQVTDGMTYDLSFGGTDYGYPGASPIIASTITINGVTRSFAGTSNGFVYTSTDALVEHFVRDISDDGLINVNNYMLHFGELAGAPASLDQNFGPVAFPGDGYGYAQWYTYDYARDTELVYTYADLGTDAVYSVRSAVPEPASWALVIAGFGMVGGTLRRRRGFATA